MKDQRGQALTGVVATLLVIGLAVGGYFAYWFIAKDVNNRNAHLQRTTYEQQATYRDEMVRKIQDVRAIDVQIQQSPDATAQLQAQRAAIVNIVCRDNSHINGGLDADTSAFVAKECA